MNLTHPKVIEYVKQRADIDTACRDKCVPWTGTCFSKKGAPRINLKDANGSLPAFLYEYAVGPIPPGKYAFMICLNRLCANPHHVIAATPQIAVRLRMGWRLRNGVWYCPRGHRVGKNGIYRNKTREHCRECYESWILNRKIKNASVPNRKKAFSGSILLHDFETV